MAFVISDYMPSESWWLDREFYRRQKHEQARMVLSRYGQPGQIITGVEAPTVKAKKREGVSSDDAT